MSSRSGTKSKMDKEREKVIQDRLQVLLTQMLKDDDNKYCVDCDAKGPRWASWNLGIFMCIRCAGIHRNLGVHISKVRSVNLDSWTPVQVASMQMMGNSRARAVYEANLPDGFIRPQSDGPIEQFIRAKYERKKYIAKEYVPQKPPEFPEGWQQLIEAEKQKKDIRKLALPAHTHSASSSPAHTPASPSNGETARPKPLEKKSPQIGVGGAKKVAPPVVPKSAADDLLGLGLGTTSSAPSNNDFFGIGNTSPSSNNGGFADFVSAPAPATSTAAPTANNAPAAANSSNTNNTAAAIKKEEDDFFAQTSTPSTNGSQPANDGKMSKDSIMALFAKSPASPALNTSSPAAPTQNMQNMFGGSPNLNLFNSPNNVQQQKPANNMFSNGNAGQQQQQNIFGVNPQSNPFLNQSPAAPAAPAPTPKPAMPNFAAFPPMGGMSTFGNGAPANQMSNMTSGMSGLNLGQGFNGIPLDPAANKPAPMPAAAPAPTPNQQSAVNDILGLW